MHKWLFTLLLTVLIFPLGVSTAHSWGFYAHKRINRLAVFTLPPEMVGFYKSHIEFVTEHAVDPDKRRYAVEGEAENHFIDIDHYSKEDPFGVMPRTWKEAVARYTEDTLRAYGIVPWHIQKMMYRLTDAFKAEDAVRILKLSSDLGHYVGDAHVPLHTTENYNGDMTDQRGIHGFWESRLPELHAQDYDYFTGRASYIESSLDAAWDAVKGSHYALDSVLGFEAKLNTDFPPDRKYSYETRGTVTMKQYSQEYSTEYHRRLDGQVERRMLRAIVTIGSMWYTAWVNAGKPDLSKIDDPEAVKAAKLEYKAMREQWKQENIKSRQHEH